MLTLKEAGLKGPPYLAPFNAHIDTGELLVIIGPNGAGKSTLLGLLSGFHCPDQGSVHLDGRCLSHWPAKALAARRAVVAQKDRPIFAWRVEELVTLGAQGQVSQPWLHELDLTSLAERSVLTLSGGELQRVMIARALAQLDGPVLGTRYLLLDEPTSALDIGQQQSLMRLLRRLTRQYDLSVICVLHDLNLASSFADRIWLLNDGQRIAAGRPDEVLRAQQLAHIYRAELEDIPHPSDRGHWLALKR
uniref:ATP-binding cassette domain-containing protein n=1 Tax=Halomonas sp. TaxID=1486246 RepID=UPI0026320E1C|nr:ATP-binding cassette domain-containing protein [Halomonas sp.]